MTTNNTDEPKIVLVDQTVLDEIVALLQRPQAPVGRAMIDKELNRQRDVPRSLRIGAALNYACHYETVRRCLVEDESKFWLAVRELDQDVVWLPTHNQGHTVFKMIEPLPLVEKLIDAAATALGVSTEINVPPEPVPVPAAIVADKVWPFPQVTHPQNVMPPAAAAAATALPTVGAAVEGKTSRKATLDDRVIEFVTREGHTKRNDILMAVGCKETSLITRLRAMVNDTRVLIKFKSVDAAPFDYSYSIATPAADMDVKRAPLLPQSVTSPASLNNDVVTYGALDNAWVGAELVNLDKSKVAYRDAAESKDVFSTEDVEFALTSGGALRISKSTCPDTVIEIKGAALVLLCSFLSNTNPTRLVGGSVIERRSA